MILGALGGKVGLSERRSGLGLGLEGILVSIGGLGTLGAGLGIIGGLGAVGIILGLGVGILGGGKYISSLGAKPNG